MKTYIYSSILVLFCFIATAQSKTEYHIISLAGENAEAVPMPFYVVGVFDGRQFTDNIGTVQKGIANRPVLTRFGKPFLEETTQYLTAAYPKKDGAYPVWVRINDLYISEYTDRNEETGYASVVMDVMTKKNDTLYIEGTFGGNIEGTAGDVTKTHPLRLRQALNKCLGLYEVALPEDKIHEVFTEENIKREIPLKPAEGAYSSYLDMVKNKPLGNGAYYLKQDKDKYYVINKTNSQKCGNFYAYSDGENVYLNVSKLAKENYYAKTERVGDKYYIDNVAYNQYRAGLQVAMYMAGGYVAGSMVETTMPLLVDCYSGQPFFLSNSVIKTMLEPYPLLLQEYKKSKKQPEDIKRIVIKYVEQSTAK